MNPHAWIGYRQDHFYQASFHSHTHFEIYYFHEGECNYLIGDKIYVLEPGDLIIMHGMTLHRPHVKGETYVRTVVHFDPGFAQTLFQFSQRLNILQPFYDLRNHRVHLAGEKRVRYEALLEKLHRTGNSEDARDVYEFHIGFMELLLQTYRLFESEMQGRSEFHSLKEEHTQSVIDYIEKQFRTDIHLHDIEDALHLNRYYLAKTFKEVTGTTIFQYLSERRINEAKMLILLNPELSITEVSYQTGFKHLPHFSRMFKKLVGMTPDQYRKRSHLNTNES